jgi:hypothetical protein
MPTADPDFLRQEYFQLQQIVETFDQKALTIKAWSVTFSMAGVATAFANLTLLLLSAAASMLFRLIEAHWKLFQQAYYPRIREIESMMAGEQVAHPASPRIAASWLQAWRSYHLVTVLGWSHVFLPHAVVVIGCVAVWALNARYGFMASP